MAAFQFELVSPEKLLFSGEVEAVVVPGAEGEFTVMKGHAPMMTTLRPGVVEIDRANGRQKLFVRGGFADVNAKGLTLLAEQAIALEELNAETLNAEIRNAAEDVADAKTDELRRRAQEKLEQMRELKAALGI
jgi:F-type H+-transporting ATPase subunit epsilon